MPDNFVRTLGFQPFMDVSARVSMSDVCGKEACGIYILRFCDDSFYVGQSRNIARRFLQHRKNFGDIAAITFRKCRIADLDRAENAAIAAMEERYKLRNIALTTLPQISECELDEIMPVARQEEWLANPVPTFEAGKRIEDPVLRYRTEKRCKKLLEDEHFRETFLPVMQRYVRLCIPEPWLTEITWWGCSCLPPYNRGIIIYSRINLRFQEVFTACHIPKSGEDIYSWHIALSPISDCFRDIYPSPGSIELSSNIYPAGGSDQLCIRAYDEASAMKLLEQPDFILAAKKFNLARMRTGAQPWAKFHAPGLADALLPKAGG